MSDSKIYIRCKQVNNLVDTDETEEETNPILKLFTGGSLSSKSASVSMILVFSLFLILFIYFIGKFLFKSTPEKYMNEI
tara:strand:+ start:4980 stop:5216 length:237 start_codon:yes stop_codon:yes gene_type:complete